MQNYKRKLGNQGFGDYGSNNYLQSSGTELQWITFKDFTGLSGVNAREDTFPQFSPDALDVYVTENDRLTVVPGTVLFEQFVGHNPSRVALHTALNYTSDLVLFDAPSIGIKHEGTTQWYNVGLPTGRPYTWANFGGTLLFSNGNLGMYAREQGETTVELVEGAPAARAYASWAGRVWAGHAIIDGNREPLGLAWSAASGDYHDWALFDENGAVTGAGFELLIDDMAAGDALVALRPMGLDFMAIMLRNSIWIASRTGNALRPGDFQPRVSGVGAINEECCKTTRFGVIFLADGPGIYLFNGNSADFISDEITSQLKTLSRSELASCTAEYNPLNRCYYLFTSIGTFIYDFERKRWHRRSMLAMGGAVFATQMVGPTWAEITGSWADQNEVWQDLNPEQQDDLVFYLLGTRGADGALDNEDIASAAAFGLNLNPYWEFPLSEGLYSTQLVTIKQVIVNYDAPGTIELEFPDINGAYGLARTAVLAGTGPRTLPVFGENTGKGAGLRVNFTVGKASLTRVQLGAILRGPRIEHLPSYSLEEQIAGLLLEDTFNRANGAVGNGWTSVNGTWNIVDNALQSSYSAVSYFDYLVHTAFANLNEVFMQAEVSVDNGAGQAFGGFLLRSSGPTSGRFPWSDSALALLTTANISIQLDFVTVTDSIFASEQFAAATSPGVFKVIQGYISDANQAAIIVGEGSALLAIDLGTTFRDTAGIGRFIYVAGTVRVRNFFACKNSVVTVTGVPTGMKIRIADVVAVEVGNVCSLDVKDITLPISSIKLLSSLDVVVANLEGRFFPGGTYALLYE